MNLPSSSEEHPKKALSKYREVERILKLEIEAGLWKAGDRLPGEYDLANRFGVSYLTLRQAIAELAAEGILLRVRGKGTYILDRSAKPASIRALAHPMTLVFPRNWLRRDPYYFPEVLDGFEQVIEGLRLKYQLVHDNVADNFGILAPNSAVACLLSDEPHLLLLERLRDQGHLVLGINRYNGRRSIPTVRVDDQSGVEAAVEYLVSQGHEHLGFVCGPPNNFDAIARLLGFRTAAKRLGLKHTSETGDDFGEAAGYDAGKLLLTIPTPPTAILCASDLSAIGLMRAAADLQVGIPESLSVIGFGDFSVAHYMRPRLTTVRQDRVGLGMAAARALLALASDEPVSDHVLKPELILRESVGRRSVSAT